MAFCTPMLRNRAQKFFYGRLSRVRSTSIILLLLVFTILSWTFMDVNISQRVDNDLSITNRNKHNKNVTTYIYDGTIANSNSIVEMSNSINQGAFRFYLDQSTEYTIKDTKNTSTLENTTFSEEVHLACVFPNVNPFEESVMKVAGLNKETIQCDGSYLPDITYIEGQELVINSSTVDKYIGVDGFKKCRYRQILRHGTNDNMFRSSKWEEPFTNRIELKKNSEFLQVECTNNKSELVSKSYWPLIPRNEEFDEMDYLNFKKRQTESAPKETLNVIMICLDSLPRNQFLRSLVKTYSYLTNNLTSFDLTMHAQLGINTFHNSLPLFTGHSIEETNKWWTESNHMDTLDIIWRTFEKAGYRTLFAEDEPYGGAFNYLKKGFKYPFARYNNRPLALAMEEDKDIWSSNNFCAGNQLEVNFLLNYVGSFLDTFSENPVFGVLMLTKATHDDTTNAKMLDDHMLNFYQSLNERGHLNRTLLISFSDHGPRWGAIRDSLNGEFESRTPYTILTFPDWFLTKHPEVAINLKINTKRLTTHYDTHATLQDLLYFKSDMPPPLAPLRHGISLFDVIPWDRTCNDVPIPADFCMCGYQNFEEISIQSQISSHLAKLVLKSLNSKINSSLCAVLKIKDILRIVKILLDENTTKVKNNQTVYKVKLQTSPGDGIFETNVYGHNGTDWSVGHNIDRLNLYRGQADCVQNANDRLFCYCKDLLKHAQDGDAL